jgi:FG-GAP repeat
MLLQYDIEIDDDEKGVLMMLPMPYHRFILAVIALLALGVLPASGQALSEAFKLTASDGAAGDFFGVSIAIDNGIIAVGGLGDDDNGDNSGSAYLFDASTSTQIAKLLPNDGAATDYFGSSIAIDNGIVAVGAKLDDDNGDRSGSAYLFDASTGTQLFKLLPNDGATLDNFGFSIAIANGVVAVGSPLDGDNGSASGSVYLFDAFTGAQISKLLPNDGAFNDNFGSSIAIANGVVAVGSPLDGDNGSASGSAYLFDASTSTQLFKLLPNDGATGDRFGFSIAIDNGVVAVGAYKDADNGQSSGSAYLFDMPTGTQIAKLLPNDGANGQEFGYSIAIDNGVVAVGARHADNGNSTGSAYIFNASTGELHFKLLPSDGAFNDNFGFFIAIANGIAAVGSPFDGDNGTNSGSAYLFDIPPFTEIFASDGAASDNFGYSIAIDNGIVAVGAWLDDDNGSNSGSAYLFDASTGVQLFKLLPNDGATSDWFGSSIAIDNGVVAIGAPLGGDNGSGSGSAYLFDASTGVQLFKLLPNEGATGDQFGYSISIDNGVVAVGAIQDNSNGSASGSAYLFDASTSTQLFKLLPNDGATGDWFGSSIAIANGVVAVGAYQDDDNGTASGSAYLFDTSTSSQLFKLLPNDGAASDNFGYSIAIDNGVVAVGAYRDDDNGGNSGSAYLFDASTGAQLFKILPKDGATGDWFGSSIAIANGIVAVGAYQDDDNGSASGSVYVFDASTNTQLFKLLASDGAANDNFGFSIAIDNGVVALGVLQDDSRGTNSGSAHVFVTGTSAICAADLTGDGVLNFFDVSAFLQGFASQDPIADFTGDGLFNFFDVSAFLIAFAAGCP